MKSDYLIKNDLRMKSDELTKGDYGEWETDE